MVWFSQLILLFSLSLSGAQEMKIKLPKPQLDSHVSLEKTLAKRRSTRNFSNQQLSLQEVSQILWAAQGITSSRGFRTSPSAGALYPLEVYLVVGNVERLTAGVYHYDPKEHELQMTIEGDLRSALTKAALGQGAIQDGAVNVVFAAVYERTTSKYGQRGIQYVHMDAGHAAQNVCLQATALELGAVTIGAFRDEQVSETLKLPGDEVPLYILPVGRP